MKVYLVMLCSDMTDFDLGEIHYVYDVCASKEVAIDVIKNIKLNELDDRFAVFGEDEEDIDDDFDDKKNERRFCGWHSSDTLYIEERKVRMAQA